MSQYFLSHDGQQMGPLTLTEIVEGVRKNKYSLTDYIYDETKQDWVLLVEYEAVAQQVKDHKPTAKPPQSPPTPTASVAAENNVISLEEKRGEHEWYILKGENKFGPFTLVDVVKMLQQKVIFEFDFLWHSGLTSWRRVAELEEFKTETMKKLKDSNSPELQEVFFRRRHRRMDFNGTILIHDNKAVWKGQGLEISAGGAGVIMDNAMIVPGQTLYLHFKPCDGVPPFNAVCEVVSKQYVAGINQKDAPVRYGLKFTSINANTQQALQELTRKQAA